MSKTNDCEWQHGWYETAIEWFEQLDKASLRYGFCRDCLEPATDGRNGCDDHESVMGYADRMLGLR